MRSRRPLVPGLFDAVADLVDDDAGRPVVLELELTEPSRFLPQARDAAGCFVGAVRAAVA